MMLHHLSLFLIGACLFVSASAAFTSTVSSFTTSTRIPRTTTSPVYLNSDEDDEIDPDSLGDWRAFRRNLAAGGAGKEKSTTAGGSVENEQVLRTQNEALADEYKSGVWAHETSTPELGGLVCRLPLEVEIHRNYKHSLIGQKLHETNVGDSTTKEWYREAQSLVEREMQDIASNAQGGQVDASSLKEEAAEMLQLYIDNQETWQQVCLVIERDEDAGTATTLVLNRPMAFQLTQNLARLVLHGSYLRSKQELLKFMIAFGKECAVYVGGTEKQQLPAIMLHGIQNLPGARQVAPGIYQGGVDAAIDGVLAGKYKPLDFKFFVGRHVYSKSRLDVEVLLGKYQPIACARSLALKQCISLPKPLWHEVLELCGGELKEISSLELLKRSDLLFEVVEEEDEEDELDGLETFEDDDEEDYYL